MSELRVFGLVLGLIGIYFAFSNYRGVNWKKSQFMVTLFFSLACMFISLAPGLIDFLPRALNMEDGERGRLLALIITAIFVLFFLFLSLRDKEVELRRELDELIRKVSLADFDTDYEEHLKPIMVLIPAFNEADNLSILLKKIPKSVCGYDVGCIVIDDGSEDSTQETTLVNGFICIKNIINKGQGSACRLGYELLKRKAVVEAIVTIDADNQHDPDEMSRLVSPILKGDCDLVIGSRRLGSSTYSDVVRAVGVTVFTWIINFVTGANVTDCSSGYKAFSRVALNRIELFEDQFQSAEVIVVSAKAGLKIKEVPITMSARQAGTTKKGGTLRYGYNFFKVLVKSWWR